MTRFSTLMVALALVLLLAVAQSGPVGEKLASCCKSVNRLEIHDDITGYMIQKRSGSCVAAVIFQTGRGLFCSQLTAPWVRRKILAFQRAKAQASVASWPTVSGLSASPSPPSSSSSSSLSSFTSPATSLLSSLVPS